VVSVASLWEIAIGRSLGKQSAPDDLPDRISKKESWLSSAADHAWELRALPMITATPSTASSSPRR
jgi:PIN domain nuclease of toxin-antitoxin system